MYCHIFFRFTVYNGFPCYMNTVYCLCTGNAVSGEPGIAGGAAAGKLSSVGDVPAAAQSIAGAQAAAPGAATSKSKQGLEKILDTLSKMFPDVRRLPTRT